MRKILEYIGIFLAVIFCFLVFFTMVYLLGEHTGQGNGLIFVILFGIACIFRMMTQ